jgi:hypothetical protein
MELVAGHSQLGPNLAARVANNIFLRGMPFRDGNQPMYSSWFLVFWGLVAVGLRRKGPRPDVRVSVLFMCVLLAGLWLCSCSSTSAPGSSTSTATITASTSGANAISHTVTVTVTH